MDTAPQLEINGVAVSDHLKEVIDGHLQHLEDRYGRLTSCRLAVKAPGAHHRMGEPYGVSIHISLPGRREVNVAPVFHNRDPRHADIIFAVNDAFRRAAAQLGHQVQKLQEHPKPRRRSTIGHIARLEPEKSCGFLTTEDQREIYFHAHSVLGHKFEQLNIGDRVAYHEEAGLEGSQASTVRLLNGACKA